MRISSKKLHKSYYCLFLVQAIKNRDFETFARITMQDSNQFHAVALDTYPPCVYMNDVSHSIASLIHTINKLAGRIMVRTALG